MFGGIVGFLFGMIFARKRFVILYFECIYEKVYYKRRKYILYPKIPNGVQNLISIWPLT